MRQCSSSIICCRRTDRESCRRPTTFRHVQMSPLRLTLDKIVPHNIGLHENFISPAKMMGLPRSRQIYDDLFAK